MNRTVTFELPEEIAARADAAGLLDGERLTRLIESELRAERERRERREQALRELQRISDRMKDIDGGLTMEEINEEVQAARAERRQRQHETGS
jgi:hypothetical protein